MSLKSCFSLLSGLTKISQPLKSYSLLNVQKSHYEKVIFYCTAKRTIADIPKPLPKQIYYGVLTPQIKAVKFFSLSSSGIGISCQPFLYNAVMSTGNVPIMVAAYSFIGFFTFVTPLLLHFITKKYVTHLEYKEDTDTYIAKTVNFFCVTTETEFKIDEVKVPEVPGMFTTLLAKGKPLFLDPRLFEHPQHYARMMGYDKPMDFKLYETSSEEEKRSK